MSGALSTDDGSETNFLCQPFDPEYANYTSDVDSAHGEISGAEYEGDPDVMFDRTNRDGQTFVYEDVPCAVCLTTRSSTIVIPAKRSCPTDCTVEYVGYLTSAGKESINNVLVISQ